MFSKPQTTYYKVIKVVVRVHFVIFRQVFVAKIYKLIDEFS